MKTIPYKSNFRTAMGLGILGILLWPAFAKADSGRIELSADLNQSLLECGKKQTAYLKVSLTGFERDCMKRRAPVNVAIVIDKSGSMQGSKIERAREAALLALDRLDCQDILSVVVYDSEPHVLVPATRVCDKQAIARQIRCLRAGGSTALYGGVQLAAAEMRKFIEDNRVHRMLLLSDGLANVGPKSPRELGRLGSKLIAEGISVTTIGIGLGYNEDLMTQLAYSSDGHHYFAEDACELADLFNEEFDRTLSVVAQDVRIRIDCLNRMRPVRLLGREGDIKGNTVTVDLNQLFSQRSKYFLLEVEIPEWSSGKQMPIAWICVDYQNLKTREHDQVVQSVKAYLTTDAEQAQKSINKDVMASVVEQLAVERNELATALRDKGQIAKAKQVLLDNAEYLRSNSGTLDAPALMDYAVQNDQQAMTVSDEETWDTTRKSMREGQSVLRTQR